MIITATKLVLETQSPMAINTGLRELGFDSELVRDTNGLPMIPSTALTGQLSHHCERHLGEELKDKWFGTTEQSSTLFISHGLIINSHYKSVDHFISQNQLDNDPLLSFCAQSRPHHRERVAINDRGVAVETSKFDQILLPKGIRFEVMFHWSTQERHDSQLLDVDEWHQILSLINMRTFALGSSTRNGLGCIDIVASKEQQFDLSPQGDGKVAGKIFKEFRDSELPTSHELEATLTQHQPILDPYCSVRLKALDNWRCGSGMNLLSRKEASNERTPDIITYSEPMFEWESKESKPRAKLKKHQALLCGSSIKGILAHRIAFHLNRHTNRWADTLADSCHDEWQKKPDLLKLLFGDADEEHQNSLAGVLFVDDAQVDYKDTIIRHHNSIDRFTGGVRQGALYSEELLYQPEFTLNLYLSTPFEQLDERLKLALSDTLTDLKEGLLPIGAGSGRGTSLVIAMPQSEGA